jgi:MoaA/NifB/PqqE/SkfB family radical SAM enzyme
MLMVGNEGETEETIKETLIASREIEPDKVQVKTTKVYPGTRLHDIAEKSGIVTEDYYLKDDEMPPVFTAENSEETIKRWKSMFRLRNLTLEIQKECNNNCSLCTVSKGRKLNTEEVKDAILELFERCDTLTLSGGDPLIRNDIFEILEFCSNIPPLKLQLRTNARMAKYRKFSEKIAGFGLHRVIVPVYSHREDVHDRFTKVSGSLRQTLSGIRNLREHGVKISVQIPLLEENFKEINETVKIIIDTGIKEFSFDYNPLNGMSPRLYDAGCSLRKVFEEYSKSGSEFSVTGIPYCMIRGFKEKIDEIRRPFDELRKLDGKIVNIGRERRESREYRKVCSGCSHKKICEGFWVVG